MTRFLWIAVAVVAGCASAPEAPGRIGQARLATPISPAEACDFRCTSTYAQVVRYLDDVARLSRPEPGPDLHLGAFGTSVEGRSLPLVVVGAPSADPAAIRATGKTRVLVFANIHAGEVAGKDALLILLRHLARGQHAHWADSLVVMVAPIYNADGNERFATGNRPRQLGPVDGMGQRPNADGLDLNRDFMKLASPEARALVGLIDAADPHLVVDLHTTNGTRMGYHLTYAPGLSPNTPPAIDADLRERWLPAISAALLASDDFATYHYGNVPGAFGEAATAPRGWYSFSPQPRFGTNYAGLRGRYAILSEAYSYAPYAERVAVTRRFVEEILDQAHAEATLIRRRTAQADAAPVVGETVALRATWDALPEPVEILLGEVDSVAHPVTGDLMLRRRDVRTPERMPAYVRFAPTETTVAPRAYVLTRGAGERLRELLEAHGIRTEPVSDPLGPREGFRLDSVRTAERPFQGVRMQEAFGAWRAVRGVPGLVVPVDQPLGRLVVQLLEPRSDDGVVAWGLLADLIRAGHMPIERIPAD